MERDRNVEMVNSCLCAIVLARTEGISGRRPGHDNI
jgi:hypothetical protein